MLFLIFNLSSSFIKNKAFDNKENLCGLEVADAYTQEVLGKNIGFYVKFYNNSDKIIDAITYKVMFKNGFNEIKGTPVEPDVYAQLLRSYDDGIAEFLELESVKPNTLGNTRMLKIL